MPKLICIPFLYLMVIICNGQPVQKLSLEQSIHLGMDASNMLKVSQAKYDYANSQFDEVNDYQYPQLKLNLAYSRLSDVPEFQVQFPGTSEPQTLFPVYLNSFQNKLSLNEVVFAGFRVKYYKEASASLLASANYDYIKDSSDVKLNIINAFLSLFKVQQSVKVIAQNLELINQRLKDVKNMEDNGMAIHNDVLRMELQQSNTQLSLLDAENIERTARYSFNLLIGQPGETTIELDTTGLFKVKQISTQETYQNTALKNRPEVQSLQMKSLAAENNLIVAKRGYWPTLSANADLFYSNPNVRYIPPVDVFHTTWDVGVALNWDITSLLTNKHSISLNEALVSQTDASKQLLKDQISSDVYQSYITYSESLEKLTVLQKAYSTAKENLSVSESRYNNGVALISDVTDAETQLMQTEINLILAKADTEMAYYKLLKSSGSL